MFPYSFILTFEGVCSISDKLPLPTRHIVRQIDLNEIPTTTPGRDPSFFKLTDAIVTAFMFCGVRRAQRAMDLHEIVYHLRRRACLRRTAPLLESSGNELGPDRESHSVAPLSGTKSPTSWASEMNGKYSEI
jgi:hypothetical protein